MKFFYLVGLTEFSSKNVPNSPLGIFNGQRFVIELGYYSIVNTIRLMWAYGLSLLDVPRKVKRLLKKFVTIYDIQAEGTSFRTVPDMVTAMCGHDMFEETQVLIYFILLLLYNVHVQDYCILQYWVVHMNHRKTAIQANQVHDYTYNLCMFYHVALIS